MRPPFLGYEPNLELADGHAAVDAVSVSVHPRAGLQLQHVLLLVQSPYAGEGGVEVSDHSLRGSLEDITQGTALGESGAHVRSERCLACPTFERLLGPLALGDVADGGTDDLFATVVDDARHHLNVYHRPILAP